MPTATSKPAQPTAAEAFIAHKLRIDAMLARLQTLSEDHFNARPDAIHWGHAGSLTEIETHLQRALDFADTIGG